MYKEKSFENILSDMLQKAPDGIDTRCGSIFYDAVAPVAAELAKLYESFAKIMDEAFPDTASEEYLTRYGQKYGISRLPATQAVLSARFNMPISEGTRFMLGEYTYVSDEFIKYQSGNYYYKLYCETVGASQNSTVTGNLIPLSYIDGLTYAKANALLVPGEDEEDTESFRKRVCAAASAVPYGGNIADYTSVITNIEGVGGVKIYPAWQGGGTLRALIQASDGGAPSETLLNEIRSTLDPDEGSGLGKGIAPIGHKVTVEGVKEYSVKIRFSPSYGDGWSASSALPYIKSAIGEYISELCDGWSKSDGITLRIAQIESAILNTGCIIDISQTMIYSDESGSYLSENLYIDENYVPILDEITVD